MWRYLVGAVAALLLAGAGVLLFRGKATAERLLPAMAAQSAGGELPDDVPEATAKTREQKRFNRYDKDKNGAITREEYLANRRKAYARLDTNHDGILQFDEWAAKAEAKFAAADADKNGAMNAAEFATTAVKRKTRVAKGCPPNDQPPPAEKGESEDS